MKLMYKFLDPIESRNLPRSLFPNEFIDLISCWELIKLVFVITLAGTITTILDSLGHFVVTGQNTIMSHSYQEKQVLEYQSLQGKNESFGRYLTNFQKKALMKAMQSDIDLEYKKRIQIILMADMGKTQAQICRLVGCSR